MISTNVSCVKQNKRAFALAKDVEQENFQPWSFNLRPNHRPVVYRSHVKAFYLASNQKSRSLLGGPSTLNSSRNNYQGDQLQQSKKLLCSAGEQSEQFQISTKEQSIFESEQLFQKEFCLS